MNHHRNYAIFGGLGLLLTAAGFAVLWATTDWAFLVNWIIAASVVAFAFYGIDKGLSKTNARRIPEAILHMMALIGGFAGAALGMMAFRHKTNFSKHPLFIPIIVLAAAVYAFLLYQFVLSS